MRVCDCPRPALLAAAQGWLALTLACFAPPHPHTLSLLAQLFMTRGLQLENASLMSSLNFSQVFVLRCA
jgi:hypothetical protein